MAQLGGQSLAGYSEQAIAAALQDVYALSHAGILFQVIREISDIPVWFFHEPMLAHKESLRPSELSHGLDPYDYKLGVALMNQVVMAPIGVELLPQPAETLAAENKTKYALCVGKRRPRAPEIAAGFRAEFKVDYGHMKPEFGRIRLQALFQRLGITPQSGA